jgi:acyl-coenzyme A synthetase/AMP-(fatty) acid ligase
MNPHKSSYYRAAAYVRLHARRRPKHYAVIGNGYAITYARLDMDLRAMTETLRSFDLAPGAHVAISHNHLYVQMLLVFAFESLGIVTGSFKPVEGTECHALVAGADLTMAEHPALPRPYRKLFEVTDDWVKDILATPEVPPSPIPKAAPDEAVAILRSSGTTGTPKRMLLTHAMLNTRLAQDRDAGLGLGLTKHARFFAKMHFSVGGMYRAASNCLRLGATFMFDIEGGAKKSLGPYRATHVSMMPFQLRKLLEQITANGGSQRPLLPNLSVRTVGATLPEELRRAALRHLCGRIVEAYGSNEAGPTAEIGADGVGIVAGSVQVEIADDHGDPLPMGTAGQLRLRGSGVIGGYLDDAEITAKMFRDGWFYPGDLATLIAPGRLKLLGRPGDVLNFGGIKTGCARVESRILEGTSLKDVALLQPYDGTSSPPIAACVVPDGETDMRAIAKAIGPFIEFPFTVHLVAEIPRTAEGKIQRAVLQGSVFGKPAAVSTQKLRSVG